MSEITIEPRGRGRLSTNPAAKAPLEGDLVTNKPKWKVNHPEAKGVKVIFDEVEDSPPSGLFISINGESYQITPGVEVEVPDFLLDHMDNALVGSPVVDPQTRRVTGYRHAPRFPYRVVRG